MKKRLGTIALVLALVLTALPASHAAPAAPTYTVNSTDDVNDGDCDSTHCSLREAMLGTNDVGGGGIVFDIPEEDSGYNAVTGVWTIQPATPLPLLSGGKTTINGYSQTGAREAWAEDDPANIVVEIDGSGVTDPNNQNGFSIVSSGNTIKGLAINSFGWSGIAIFPFEGSSAMNNTVAGNYIGTDTGGAVDYGNGRDGVSILLGAQNNTIGGDVIADWNIISGNGWDGVGIHGADTTGNVVSRNYIGVDYGGWDALGNSRHGVHIYGGAHHNAIGGDETEQNAISGNGSDGVYIAGGDTRNNVVSCNYIGVSMGGVSDVSNGRHGVHIVDGAHDNTIGAGNVIAYNDDSGVFIDGTSTMTNTVSGNRINHNVWDGIFIGGGAQGNIIGGDTESERNYIYSNDRHGILITESNTQNNTVSGNHIGLDNIGNVGANGSNGILLNGAQRNTIGPDNVISGNTGHGINLDIGWDNVIFGNYIGTSAGGTLASGFGNGEDGIKLESAATGNIIGGTVADEKNVIAGNAGNGITISGANTSGNVVLGNYIGKGPDAVAGDFGNMDDGVYIVDGAHDNTIGPGNAISDNDLNGVRILGAGTMSNTVSGNGIYSNTGSGVYIGYFAQYNVVSGNYIGIGEVDFPQGNGGSGVVLDFCQNNTIGGDMVDERNIISANSEYGIKIVDAQDNTIAGNYIGAHPSGMPSAGYGNVLDGIFFSLPSTTGNVIGGDTIDEGNLIYGNGGHGISFDDAAGATDNHITHNSIEYNGGEGIKVPGGWTPSAPIIAATTPGSVHITGTACAGCTVEVFQSHLDSGEGLTFVGETIADGSGDFTVTVDALSSSAPYLTATATKVNGTTSEFSAVFESTIKQIYLPLVLRD